MLALLRARQAYAVGFHDSDLSLKNLEQFQSLSEATIVYQTLTIPWSNDSVQIAFQKLSIEQIIANGREVVLVYDPVLPRTYSDTLYAIAMGLADSYFQQFFGMLRTLQQQHGKEKFAPIIIVGTSINGQQTYSSNATLFVQVFQKLVLYARSVVNLTCYFSVSYNPSICQPVILGNCTENCTITQNTIVNDYQTRLKCSANVQNFYPGDSFVDWISFQAVNQDNVQSMRDLINKALSISVAVAHGKPVMMFMGSKSQPQLKEQFEDKNQQLLDILALAQQFSKSGRFYKAQIKALIFTNVENNQDIAYYNSVKGDTISQLTSNGAKLFYYKNLKGLFHNSSAIHQFSISSAAIGSICDVGESGDIMFFDCKPCPSGQFQNQTGQSACQPCPIGTYQDEPGSQQCKQCPELSTTLSVGTQLLVYCTCNSNYVKNEATQLCEQCPRNYYSKMGSECIACPADATFKGSKGQAGEGCFCLAGYVWSSPAASCIKGAKSGYGSMYAVYTIAAVAMVGVLW